MIGKDANSSDSTCERNNGSLGLNEEFCPTLHRETLGCCNIKIVIAVANLMNLLSYNNVK